MSSLFEPSSRRLSNSCLIRHFYSAVKVINGQRQAANAIRICKYMQRHHGIKAADCIAELELCVRDGLLHFERTVGKKGSKRGAVQERYVVPTNSQRDGHDWYCFECHKGGEVKCCSSCHRVYHTYCIKDFSPDNLVCYICIAQEDRISFTKEKLNRLLGYLHRSMKELVPTKLKQWKKSDVEELATKALLYNPVDMNTIQKRILNSEYSHWLQFAADVKNYLHNIIIYFGERSSFTQQLSKLIEYCLHDIKEIEKCADCYEASNDRVDKLWFCKPCQPLHKLVFAKLETFPFWPAKVITQYDDKYDVRFFGSGHTRSVISKSQVKPIPPSIKYIQKLPKYGSTLSWEKAMNELIFHIICIGPQVKVERLPANYHAKRTLQVPSPNPQRIAKRKISCNDPKNKRAKLQEETRGNKTQNVYKSRKILVRKVIGGNKEHGDNIVDKNSSCAEENSEQPVIAKDIPKLQSQNHTIVQAEMQEVDVPEKTDLTNVASRSDVESDTVSISELHEEIDIKDEYVEENEIQIEHVESVKISETNVTSDKSNSDQVKETSSHHSLLNSTIQKSETLKIIVPKKKDSVVLARQPKMQSGSLAIPEGLTIKKITVDNRKYQLSKGTQIGGVQKSKKNQNCGNCAEHSCSSSKNDESLEILAESIIVKEEPPCLNCSGLDMIPRKEAEKLKEEAVAKTTEHFLAIIARLEKQCSQTKDADRRMGNGI